MKVHILGICGTFMGGIAILARQLGYEVSGSDANVYPPMSTQLKDQGITLYEGYDPAGLPDDVDLVVIGNAMSRGNPLVEHVLDRGLAYTSGPAFLADNVLNNRWVLAVSGTHGKTTTSSMLAWLLEYAKLDPGFLIGGIPKNFNISARLGSDPFFIVEADEYDSAFFDKRSKFIHYRPRTLIINNLEYDHADIFPDLESIQRQFQHLIRTVPGSGLLIVPGEDDHIKQVLEMGCWTPIERFSVSTKKKGGDSWRIMDVAPDYRHFTICRDEECFGTVKWNLQGAHNVANALAAIIAARHAGIAPAVSVEALASYEGVKRRMEKRGIVRDISIYDDFAHHPTAIATTLQGLRQRVGNDRVIAILEMRSNTMKLGVHKDALAPALNQADEVILYRSPGLNWDLNQLSSQIGQQCQIFDQVDKIVGHLKKFCQPGDHVLIMSNGGFENIHQRLIDELSADAD